MSCMEERAVTVVLRYKDLSGTWRRSPAARGKNGRIKPDSVLVDGKVVSVTGGHYQLRVYENRRTVFVKAGSNASMADAQRSKLEQVKTAKAAVADAGLRLVEEPERRSLKGTAAAYIKDAEGRNATEAAEQARLVTTEFIEVARKRKKTYIDEIDRDDIFAYHVALRMRGCEDRTVANKHQRMASWLRFAGVDRGLDKDDPGKIIPPKPKFEDKLPTIYESDPITTLLGKADPYMTICILLALKCGLRDQELMHVEFTDIGWKDGMLRVQGKPRWGFTVKTWEQREIPIPDDVLEKLKNWQDARAGQTLILGTKNRLPNTKLLRTLKRLVHNAGLNCKRCKTCLERNECEGYTLHRFRRTYITTLLRSGIDLRTVQAYAGHKDLASTMRYLRPATGKEAKAKLNAVKW
jgi:integrase